MTTRIAINGFGRIGRLVYRALFEQDMLDDQVEVVAVNDLVPAENLAYLLKHDTVHGTMGSEITVDGDMLTIGSRKLKTLALKVAPNELPWKELGIDLVIESTGHFSHRADAEGHLAAGAKKVLITAPSDADVPTYVYGVNHEKYAGESVISNASCTTNCLVPLVHVLLKEGIGLEEGLMTTIHSLTASEGVVDGPSKKDFRLGRASGPNLIPTSTGAAKAVALVLPETKGKLTGVSIRVPTEDVSLVDLTFRPARDTSIEEINALMKKASETYLQGVLAYTEEPVVSSDFVHDPNASVYDATACVQLNPRFFKLMAWYDNEWGYSQQVVRMIDQIT